MTYEMFDTIFRLSAIIGVIGLAVLLVIVACMVHDAFRGLKPLQNKKDMEVLKVTLITIGICFLICACIIGGMCLWLVSTFPIY